MQMQKRKDILTAKELAEYLKIHPFTVHKFAREGKIPAFKIGTDWRFHKKLIDKWIKQKTTYNKKKLLFLQDETIFAK